MKLSFKFIVLQIAAVLLWAACDQAGAPAASPVGISSQSTATRVPATQQATPSVPASQPAPTMQSTVVPTALPPTLLPASTPTIAPSPSSASGVPSGDPRAVLREAYARLASAGPYRIIETNTYISGGQTQSQTLTRELIPPGRVRIVGKPEMIQIDRVWYMQDGSGKWTKSDVPPSQVSKKVNVADLLAQAISDVQVVGTEALNGMQVVVLTMNVNFASNGFVRTVQGVDRGSRRLAATVGSTRHAENVGHPGSVSDAHLLRIRSEYQDRAANPVTIGSARPRRSIYSPSVMIYIFHENDCYGTLPSFDDNIVKNYNTSLAHDVPSQPSLYRSREIASHKTLAMTVRSVMYNTHTATAWTVSQ